MPFSDILALIPASGKGKRFGQPKHKALLNGKTYYLKNIGTGTITLNTTSSQTIDGNASGVLTMVQGDSITVISNNSNWIIT